jgi:hypothetical protein
LDPLNGNLEELNVSVEKSTRVVRILLGRGTNTPKIIFTQLKCQREALS